MAPKLYYIGPIRGDDLAQAGFPPVIAPGAEIDCRGPPEGVVGINDAYLYSSASDNTASTMHMEDASLFSCHHLLFGKVKLWTMISPTFKDLLERRLAGKPGKPPPLFSVCATSQRAHLAGTARRSQDTIFHGRAGTRRGRRDIAGDLPPGPEHWAQRRLGREFRIAGRGRRAAH